MSDEKLLKQINEDLDAAISNLTTKLENNTGPKDCIGDCANAYDACMANAGSDLEKAVCKAKYNRCISNC